MVGSFSDTLEEYTPVAYGKVDLKNRSSYVKNINRSKKSANDEFQIWGEEKTEVFIEERISNKRICDLALIDSKGNASKISKLPALIGRDESNDVTLQDKSVSRKHAQIYWIEKSYYIRDLDSSNGVTVNGRKVKASKLHNGDVIGFGKIKINFFSELSKESVSQRFLNINFRLMILFFALVVGLICSWYFFTLKSNYINSGNRVLEHKSNNYQSFNKKKISKKSFIQNQYSSNKYPKPLEEIAFPAQIATQPGTKFLSENYDNVNRDALSKLDELETDVTAVIEKSQAEYFSGDTENALEHLDFFLNSNDRLSQELVTRLKDRKDMMEQLYEYYKSGDKALKAGDKALGYNYWIKLLESEKKFFKGKNSSWYAEQVTSKVVDEYVRRGNDLAKAGNHHESYRSWRLALDIGDSPAAKMALSALITRAEQIYRSALRYEYVDSARAKKLWVEVVNLVPPNEILHIKANSKLTWYKRWGV